MITGHGSDENGCGEFCVTSHHFSVNGHVNNITFSEAGMVDFPICYHQKNFMYILIFELLKNVFLNSFRNSFRVC